MRVVSAPPRVSVRPLSQVGEPRLVYGSFVPDAGERQLLSLPKVCAKLQGGPCLRAGCPSRRAAVLSEAAIGVV